MKTPCLLRLTNLSCLTRNDIPTLAQLLKTYTIEKLEALVITGVSVASADEYPNSLITVRNLMTSLKLTPEQIMILPNQLDHQNLVKFSYTFHGPLSGNQFNPNRKVILGVFCYELVGIPTSTLKSEAVAVPPLTGSQPCKRIYVTHDPVEEWRTRLVDHEHHTEGSSTKPCSLQIMDYQPSTQGGFKVTFAWL